MLLPLVLQRAASRPVMRVAEVLSVSPHPKADRLRVCQVDAGGVGTAKVVTNAANVEEGMKVVFAVSEAPPELGVGVLAVPGSSSTFGIRDGACYSLPLQPVGCTTRSGVTVEAAVLRGVESAGMLCSAHECGWASEPDGVLVVMPEDAEVGEECPEEPPQVSSARLGKVYVV